MRSYLPLLVFFTYITHALGATQVCNNAASLCSRRYDNVTHLGAHDSPFVRNKTNDYTGAGDQVYTSLQQLDYGVRLLTAQVHKVTGTDGQVQWRLCHTLCQLYDAGYFVDWLKDIKGWLDAHPNDVSQSAITCIAYPWPPLVINDRTSQTTGKSEMPRYWNFGQCFRCVNTVDTISDILSR